MGVMVRAWTSDWNRGEQLPGGAQGFTFLARRRGHPDDSAEYILKELKRKRDATARARMCAEVASLRLVTHPSVAKLVDTNATLDDAESELFVVMEYIPGPHISDAVQTARPTPEQALECVVAVLVALDACHQADVFHRDIKPENIILRDGKWADPVLIDFGISFNTESSVHTYAHDAFGNRFLRLPEFESGSAYRRDARSDVTAAGGLLYYLVTGFFPHILIDENKRAPFARSPWAEVCRESLAPELWQRLDRFFRRSFEYALSDRWPTARAAVDFLERTPASFEGTPVEFESRLREIRTKFEEQETSRFATQVKLSMSQLSSMTKLVVKEAQTAMAGLLKISAQNYNVDLQKWNYPAIFNVRAEHGSDISMQLILHYNRVGDELIIHRASPGPESRLASVAFVDPDFLDLAKRVTEDALLEAISAVLARVK